MCGRFVEQRNALRMSHAWVMPPVVHRPWGCSSPGCPKGSHRAKETTMSQSPTITRRHFLRTGVVGAGLFLVRPFGGIRHVYADALPGGTLPSASIPKYVTPLVIPPAMPRTSQIPTTGGKAIDYYEIAVRQL